jgi:hypothetical protein
MGAIEANRYAAAAALRSAARGGLWRRFYLGTVANTVTPFTLDKPLLGRSAVRRLARNTPAARTRARWGLHGEWSVSALEAQRAALSQRLVADGSAERRGRKGTASVRGRKRRVAQAGRSSNLR